MIPLGVLVALACAYGTTFVYGRWAIAVGLAGGALAVLVFAERAARRDGEDQ